MKYYQHPIKIVTYFAKSLWLVLLPVFRNILRADNLQTSDEIRELLYASRSSIFYASILLLIGLLRWRCSFFTVTEKDIVFSKGVVIKSKTKIAQKNISTITAETGLAHAIIRAVQVQVCSTKRKIKLVLTKNTVTKLQEKMNESSGLNLTFKPSQRILFAFMFSGSLSGALYLAALFIQSGRVTEDILENLWGKNLTSAFGDFTMYVREQIAPNVSPLTAAIAVLIVATWLVSLIRNLLKYGKLGVFCGKGYYAVGSGFVTKKLCYINRERVNAVILEQNVLMKLLGSMSVTLATCGYGNRHEQSVFVPIAKKSTVQTPLSILNLEFLPARETVFGEFSVFRRVKLLLDGKTTAHLPKELKHISNCEISAEFSGSQGKKIKRFVPRKRRLLRYCKNPAIAAVITLLLYMDIVRILPDYKSALMFALIMAEISLLWLFSVKLIAALTSGVAIANTQTTVSTNKGFKFYTAIVPQERIAIIETKQNLLQKRSKSGDITVKIRGGKNKFKVLSADL